MTTLTSGLEIFLATRSRGLSRAGDRRAIAVAILVMYNGQEYITCKFASHLGFSCADPEALEGLEGFTPFGEDDDMMFSFLDSLRPIMLTANHGNIIIGHRSGDQFVQQCADLAAETDSAQPTPGLRTGQPFCPVDIHGILYGLGYNTRASLPEWAKALQIAMPTNPLEEVQAIRRMLALVVQYTSRPHQGDFQGTEGSSPGFITQEV